MTPRRQWLLLWVLLPWLTTAGYAATPGAKSLYVDGARGQDSATGTETAPLRTLQGALDKLPAQVAEEHVVLLTPGDYSVHGDTGSTLELNRPMKEAGRVRIKGKAPGVILNWTSSTGPLISVTQGHWSLEDIQVGSRASGQRGGIRVGGPALLELRNVRIRTAGQSWPGLHATRGGMVHLFGKIELNEDLHNGPAARANFCGVLAEYSGVVRFREREGASLSIGNGSLSARYYGIIELGCENARITSWDEQANTIAVNNSGRVDFHSTETVLAAPNPRNTPIGLEDDGHVLAEGARLTIKGHGNSHAIVLQKQSAFFCNDVILTGSFRCPLSAMSGSTLLVGIEGDLNGGEVSTGARIIIEKCTGRVTGPITRNSEGVAVMPPSIASVVPRADGPSSTAETTQSLPALHSAAASGQAEAVKRLLADGTKVDERDVDGRTPLHWAALRGHESACSVLLSQGADPNLRDQRGSTPLDLARQARHDNVSRLLERTAK